MNVYTWTLGASHTPAAFLAVAGHGAAVRPDRRGRELPLRPRLRARAGAPAGASARAHGRQLGAGRAARGRRGEPAGCARCRCAGPLIALALAAGLAARRWRGGLARPPRGARRPRSPASSPTWRSAQNADGGFGARRGQRSSELYTAWVAMGLAAAGRNPASVRRDGHSLLDSLRGEASTLGEPGRRRAHDPRGCAPAAPRRTRSPGATWSPKCCARARPTARSAHLVNLTAFAIFALRAAGHSAGYAPDPRSGRLDRAPAERRRRLRLRRAWLAQRRRRHRRGAAGAGRRRRAQRARAGARRRLPDALAEPRRRLPPAVRRRIERAVDRVGGAGPDRGRARTRARCGARAAARRSATCESLLAPDGSIRYSRTSAQTPVWVTAQALIALAGKTFPVGLSRQQGGFSAALALLLRLSDVHARIHGRRPAARQLGFAPAARRRRAAAC